MISCNFQVEKKKRKSTKIFYMFEIDFIKTDVAMGKMECFCNVKKCRSEKIFFVNNLDEIFDVF